jgi:hypothetical protein
VKRPLRENLELNTDSGTSQVLCARCGFVLGAEEDWAQRSHKKLLPPTAAGPLMKELEGQFLLEQLFCPGCKTLLNSEIVEVNR